MQLLKAGEERGKWGEEEEEVTVDKNKPIPLDYESEGEGWGSKAGKRQCEATKTAEEETERRNLGEEGGLKSLWVSGGDWFIDGAFVANNVREKSENGMAKVTESRLQ
ncbi:hypothetical protein L873DRAFT_1795140 [Choiromyces venosus 120613-1]|uniref:Uncharacterized protein n=1 Tax=Choiromyces venosus 120613-1 TaxID=1336337 RepID=A0A3N4J1A4_9PEZI|nr:hypothetical protein L873DRAFT_1795140 [Choiromyces venosus 120613-1]